MNAPLLDSQTDTLLAEQTAPMPFSLNGALPYLVLAVTLTALSFNLPARVAALKKKLSSHPPAAPARMVPTFGSYPVLSRPVWMGKPTSSWTRVALR